MFIIASAPHGTFDYRAGDAPAEVLRSHIQRATAELRFSAALYRMAITGLALILGALTEAAFRWRASPEQLNREREEIETILGARAADLLGETDFDATAWAREYAAWKEFRRTEFSEDAITSWGA